MGRRPVEREIDGRGEGKDDEEETEENIRKKERERVSERGRGNGEPKEKKEGVRYGAMRCSAGWGGAARGGEIYPAL